MHESRGVGRRRVELHSLPVGGSGIGDDRGGGADLALRGGEGYLVRGNAPTREHDERSEGDCGNHEEDPQPVMPPAARGSMSNRIPRSDGGHSTASAAAYGGTVNPQPASETATWSNIGPVKHGYPPPRLSVGQVTTAYCGAELIVEGECSDRPPQDACAMCALAWENSKRPGRRWARAFGIGRSSRRPQDLE